VKAYLNPVRAGVGPVQISGHPVHSYPIWVVDLRGNQHHGVAAIDVGPPDGPDLVVRPVDKTLNRVVVDGDGVADVIHLHEHQ